MKEELSILISLSWQAADCMMQFYEQPLNIIYKEDASPLTEADKASHAIICAGLKAHFPKMLTISEEDAEPFKENVLPSEFFLVDPLDGTKEFIKHNGEFTTNIAWIKAGIPVAGVVCAPAKNVLYYGARGMGAFKMLRGCDPIPISVSLKAPDGIVAVGSRSHASKDEMDQRVQSWLAVGSSLKFCLVAEGSAHVYPRLGTTMEWDTAAGQAVLMAAGGDVYTLDTYQSLFYGKPGLKNPHFIATNGTQEWRPSILSA